MRKMIVFLALLAVVLSSLLPAYAADGKVIYDGKAKEFVFAPGSEYSPTDLFPNFKDVMPGDSLTQAITLKNDADRQVKIKVYMRSLGAREDSVKFLSQLGLKVQKRESQTDYMFDAAANETAQLTDWVYLGTLYSGGEVDLDVTLTVPAEMDNAFQKQIGYLDWEFRIEEFPVEEGDPVPPLTGDDFNADLWIVLLAASALILAALAVLWARRKNR